MSLGVLLIYTLELKIVLSLKSFNHNNNNMEIPFIKNVFKIWDLIV